MAWIKMRADLHEDPAVLDLMTLTGLDVFAVIGKLHAIWSWADSASPDGHVHSVTPSSLVLHIERKVECAGFVAAMCQVGWMRIENDRIVFPKFERHMSKSAKNRALAAERQSRNRRDNTSRTKRDKSVTREEKSREDKRRAEKSKSREEETQDTDSLRSSVRAAAKRRPEGETLTAERLAFATSEGLAEDSARRAWAKMGDHEFPRPRSDWDATWRNWVRTEVERAVPSRAPAYQTAAQRSMSNLKNFLKESGAL